MNKLLRKANNILFVLKPCVKRNIFTVKLARNSVGFNKSKFFFSSNNKDDKNKEDKQLDKKEVESKLEKELKQTDDQNNTGGNDPNKDPKDNKNNTYYTALKGVYEKYYLYILLALGFFSTIIFNKLAQSNVTYINLIEFSKLLSEKRVKSIDITKSSDSNSFFIVYVNMNDNTQHHLIILDHDKFLKEIDNIQNIDGNSSLIPITYHLNNYSFQKSFFRENIIFLTLTAFGGIVLLLNKKGGNSKFTVLKTSGSNTNINKNSNIFNINKGSQTVEEKIKQDEKPNVRFNDIAGMSEPKKEIVEFVDFLKNSPKYRKLGAKIPKGALLVGPPGTGKTLLAKAIAGEAGVPFFATSGSEFVEKYVGVGALRVRELFNKAKESSPSIIFIDEIDSVGKKRDHGNSPKGNEERESTLNQLLVEMDGYGSDNTVIVIAATNRKDILDPALLRPGRFDRTIEINLPDRKEREEILRIYLNKIMINKEKSIDEYAQRLSSLTPGFSGADLSNLVNEAAIISARFDKESVDSESFEKAYDRISGGLETKRILSNKDKNTIAYHESGHAVVGWMLEHSFPLIKLTIVPRSKGSLGFAQYLPDDMVLYSKEQMLDLICVSLGGRVAEEIFFNRITTGASDDLRKVTEMARGIVVNYGMSDLGLMTFNLEESFLSKPYSPDMEKQIEKQINIIINDSLQRTRKIINENKQKIENLAKVLLDKETLNLLDIIEVLGEREYPFPESIINYLNEIKKRKDVDEEKKREERSLKEFEEIHPTIQPPEALIIQNQDRYSDPQQFIK